MPRTLDYSATWAETTASISTHKEALGAIAGLLVFIPNWIQGMLLAKLELDSLAPDENPLPMMAEHFGGLWYAYLPLILASIIGIATIYALLTRKDLPRIGDALMAGLAIAPFYFVSQLLVGIATGLAALALIVPALYLLGPIDSGGASVGGAAFSRGPLGAIGDAWELTRSNGWSVFGLLFIVGLVAAISLLVVQLLSNLAITLAAGPEGIPLLQTGISAFIETLVSVLMAALGAAIYHQLSGQEV